MTDDEYMAFLDKANKDPSEGYDKPSVTTSEAAAGGIKTVDEGADVPKPLLAVTKRNAFYTSDADEPFVPVCLAWDETGKGLPDPEELARLVGYPQPEATAEDVEILDFADWDTLGRYSEILEAVREAGKGADVRVYRVPGRGSRVEYWVLTTDGTGAKARLVGLKALAVES